MAKNSSSISSSNNNNNNSNNNKFMAISVQFVIVVKGRYIVIVKVRIIDRCVACLVE